VLGGHPGTAGAQRPGEFFSLGGDSLLATRLLASVREQLGTSLRMSDFYQQPTLAGMAALLVRSGEVAIEEGVL